MVADRPQGRPGPHDLHRSPRRDLIPAVRRIQSPHRDQPDTGILTAGELSRHQEANGKGAVVAPLIAIAS